MNLSDEERLKIKEEEKIRLEVQGEEGVKVLGGCFLAMILMASL